MRVRFWALSALAIACAMVLAACSGGDNETPTTVEGPEPSVTEATAVSSQGGVDRRYGGPPSSSGDATEVPSPPQPTGDDGLIAEQPATIPQSGPDVAAAADIPAQPASFLDYGPTTLTWLQGKTDADEIRQLLEAWQMPPASVSFEGLGPLTVVDTDLDGRGSVVMVFTDPSLDGNSFLGSDLVVFEPVPGEPGRYQIAYDSLAASGGDVWQFLAVLSDVDRTGDGRPDILYVKQTLGVSTLTSSFHLLTSDGAHYRDLAATSPIMTTWPGDNQSAERTDVESDATGDGLPDISLMGGTFGSVGAEPEREFRYVFSAAGGTLTQVVAEGQPSQWLVWALLDANTAFARQDWAAAVSLYDVVLTDSGLDEWAPDAGEAAELRALANLRKSIALARLGDSVGAAAAARALAGGTGVVAEAGAAYAASFASSGDVGAACAAFEGALSMARWDEFWSNYGYAVPRLAAGALCPG